MARERVPLETVRIARYLDIRYVGQSYELEVPLAHPVTATAVEGAIAAFHAVHDTIYGYHRAGSPLEAVNLRVVHSAPADDVRPAPDLGGEGPRACAQGRAAGLLRRVGSVPRDLSCTSADTCGATSTSPAPRSSSSPDTTTVVYPGQAAVVDVAGNLVITAERRP
jgi:N-methylhydantoinase A